MRENRHWRKSVANLKKVNSSAGEYPSWEKNLTNRGDKG